jgi:hypothetical protein
LLCSSSALLTCVDFFSVSLLCITVFKILLCFYRQLPGYTTLVACIPNNFSAASAHIIPFSHHIFQEHPSHLLFVEGSMDKVIVLPPKNLYFAISSNLSGEVQAFFRSLAS